MELGGGLEGVLSEFEASLFRRALVRYGVFGEGRGGWVELGVKVKIFLWDDCCKVLML